MLRGLSSPYFQMQNLTKELQGVTYVLILNVKVSAVNTKT
jgi:hypothetical protein